MIKFKYKITDIDPSVRPTFNKPNPEFLKIVGEDGLKQMISDFYDLVVDSEISHFFPQDDDELDIIKKHNAKFFIEICGGQKAYSEKTGHMDMHKMHTEFSITTSARYEWLGCWMEVLETIKDVDEELIQSYWDYLDSFSKLLINHSNDRRTYEDIATNKQ